MPSVQSTLQDMGFIGNRRPFVDANRSEVFPPTLGGDLPLSRVNQEFPNNALDFSKMTLDKLRPNESIQSTNYISGVSGFKINMAPDEGDVEFNDGTFRGAITGATIDIGGADNSSFHVDIDGNMWLGAAAFADAPFSVTNAGVATAVNLNLLRSYTAAEALTALDRVSLAASATSVEQTVRNNYDNPGAAANTSWTTSASIASCKATNTKFAQLCGDTAGGADLYAIAGTIDNHTLAITYGTREVVSDTFRSGGSVRALYLEDDKVMFVYIKSDGFLYATVATLSGTDFTFGAEFTIYNSADVKSMGADMVTSTTVAVGFTADNGATLVRMQGLSVSGTTISAVANVDNTGGYVASIAAAAITVTHTGSGRVGMFYRTSVSNGLGRRFTFNAGTPTETGSANFDATGATGENMSSSSGGADTGFLTFSKGGTSVVSFNLSGANPTYGTVAVTPTGFDAPALIALSSSRAFIFGRDGGAGGAMFYSELLGTSTISTQTRVQADGTNIARASVAMINSTRNRFVVGYTLTSTSTINGKVYEEYDNSNLMIGVVQSTVASGGTARVFIEGSEVSGFTGLTVGTPYYVNYRTSTLATTKTGVEIGVATTTTALRIRIKTEHVYLANASIGTTTRLYKVYHNAGKLPKAIVLQANYSTAVSLGHANGAATVVNSVGATGGLSTTNILNVAAGGNGVVATVSAIDAYSITLNATVTGAVSAGVIMQIET